MAPRIPSLPSVGDLVQVLQTQAEALAALPHTLVALNRSILALADVVVTARETVVVVQRLAKNADAVIGSLQEPLDALAPQLTRVAAVLEAAPLESVPELLDSLNRDIMPILKGLGRTQAQVAGIAGTTDRLIGMVDDATQKLQALSGLPGAGLLTRRASGKQLPK